MIGINNQNVNRKLNYDVLVCQLQDKINEVVNAFNEIVDNENKITVDVRNVKSHLHLLGNLQLQYLDGIVTKSPDGSRWKISVSDNGEVITTKVYEVE